MTAFEKVKISRTLNHIQFFVHTHFISMKCNVTDYLMAGQIFQVAFKTFFFFCHYLSNQQ